MKKSIPILLAFVISSACLFAQPSTRSWGEFNMIPKTFKGRAAAADNITSGLEYEKALKVYEQLCQARGDFRYPVPVFFLSKNENLVAKIDYSKPEKIYLGIAAFQVCETFKDQSEAAIAFLLGHELTHYYEKHAWRGNFANQNRELGISRTLDSLKAKLSAGSNESLRSDFQKFKALSEEFEEVAMEMQADYLGGFLAYSAGYGIFNDGDILIRRLYEKFGFGEKMEGYVTRTERENICKTSAARMKDLVEVFDMANLLASVGQIEEAYQYYRYLLTEYQSREVYNNVGATAMLQSLKFFTENELQFRYPIQLDLQMANHRGEDEIIKRNKLLWQAVLHFDAAISLDPQYAPAYLNKACALALLGETTRAYFYADVETRAVAKGKYAGLQQDLEVLLGILDAKPNTEEAKVKAQKRFEAVLAQKAGGVAAYNLAKLNGKTIKTQDKSFTDEEMDGESVFLMEPDIDPEKPKLEMGEGLTFVRNPKKTAQTQLYSSISATNGLTMFLLTNPDYKGETLEGIKIGASRQEIEAKYGLAPKVIQTIVGEILAYKGLLFMMKADKLERWVTYKLPN